MRNVKINQAGHAFYNPVTRPIVVLARIRDKPDEFDMIYAGPRFSKCLEKIKRCTHKDTPPGDFFIWDTRTPFEGGAQVTWSA